MSAQILPVFSKIWHTDAATRVEHSAQLIAHLEAAQASYSPEKAAEQAASSGVHDDGFASDVSYSLKRLVRGLASPRDSARLGFAVALTELLNRLSSITARQILDILMSNSQVGAGVKGPEERDLLFARLFGMHAIVTSGVIFRPTSSLHDWRVAVEETLYLGDRKTWLRESASWVVQCATKQLLSMQDLEWRAEGIQVVVNAFFSGNATIDWTPERAAMAVLLQRYDVDAPWDKITKPAFSSPNLLSSEANVVTLARILRGLSTMPESKKANNQASATFLGSGQLHYVWQELLEAYHPKSTQEPTLKKKRKVTAASKGPAVPFLDFYRIAIDESLFSPTSTNAAKYVGLLAFSACFDSAPASVAPSLLTPNLLRTLINHTSKGDRSLHTLASQVIRKMPTTVSAKPEMAYPLLMSLFKKPYGNIRFDAVTRSKTVEAIVAALPEDDIEKYVAWLSTFIVEAGASNDNEDAEDEYSDTDALDDTADKVEKSVATNRAWAIDQMLLIIRKKATPFIKADATEALPGWMVRILDFFIVHGFFSLQKPAKKSPIAAMHEKPTTTISPATQSVFRARFFSALTHLLSINPRCRSQVWTAKALSTVRALQQDEKHLKCLVSQDTLDEVKSLLSLHDQVAKLADDQRKQACLLLSEVLILQSCDPDGDASELLEELTDAVKTMFLSSKAKKQASAEEAGEAAEPISVLIDLLVNLLQKRSVLLRTTAERVFAAFSGEVGEQALQLLTDQIAPDEIVEDDMDVDADGAAEQEGDLTKGDDSSDEDDSEDDDSEDDDEDDGIDLDADPELRDKVAAALKSMGMGGDDEDEEDEQEDEDEELLDDDQMMQLDEQLAEIFRSRKTMAKENRQEQEDTLNSQLRVVDLLEIYAKQQASNPLVLQTILPLFDLACKSSGDKDELASKAAKVLRGIANKPKEVPGIDTPEDALSLLSSIHALARRFSNPDSIPLAAAASAYIARIVLSPSGERAAEQVSSIYTASLHDFLIKKHSKVHQTMFTPFVQRQPLAAWNLREQLLEACSESTETKDKHKRLQVFGILGDLILAYSALKTPEAAASLLEFMPKVASCVHETVEAAADGKNMQLQVNRLREILKFCTQAIKATKHAISVSGSSSTVSEIWKAEQTRSALDKLSASTHVSGVTALSAPIRQIINAISQSGSTGQSSKKARNVEATAKVSKKRKAVA